MERSCAYDYETTNRRIRVDVVTLNDLPISVKKKTNDTLTMKVLMFGWEFPPHISGGLGTACYGLTKALSTQDIDLIFVVPKSFGDEDQSKLLLVGADKVPVGIKKFNYKETVKEIEYVEIGSNLIPYVDEVEYFDVISKRVDFEQYITESNEQGCLHFNGGYGGGLFQEVANYAVVAKTIANMYTFDIIHAHDWLTYPAAIAAKESSGKPLVVHVHATEFDRSGEHVHQYVYDIERAGMHAADKVITVSNLTRKIVINRYGVDPSKVITVHNAVEPNEKIENLIYEKGFDDKIVTFLGRITFQKGPEYFVEAAYKVLQKNKNVKFVMAGSGDLLEKMIHRAAALGITSKFHFTGFLKGDDVVKMLNISDVYVMPSVSEPFGISPLEAMRSNVPVIISNQSGVSEILKHAIKIDFWDVDAMADAINGLLHYDGLNKMFRTHGKAEVENLKWDNSASLIKDIYEEMIAQQQ